MLQRVQKASFQHLKLRLEVLLRFFSRRRGFWLRCLLCWGIGCLALSNDEINAYDQRFHLRGDQKASSQIVLVTIRQSDFATIYDTRTNFLDNMSEVTDITDSYFWNKRIWSELLIRILRQNPKAVGVTLYFGDNIGKVALTQEEQKLFYDMRVFWSATTNNLDRVLNPAFTSRDLNNIGSNEVRRDEDGVVRRVFPQRAELPHLVEKITGKKFPTTQAGLPINFRGSNKVFTQYSFSEIMYDEVPFDAFTNKIILIGAETSSGPVYITPMGTISRTEILAHTTDTVLGNKWIQRLSNSWYAAGFFVLMLIAVFLITTYPQSVALFFILWIGTLLAALSAWVFDTFYFWSPAFSPFVLLGASWIIFIGYQASKVERKNFRLQQEQQYLQELEQLKNNFVSLISHDLKTPIAKIQAIVDRLLVEHQSKDESLSQDLQSLRLFGDELNRYIQSILKVLRVESRDFKINTEVGDINEVVEEALQQLRPLAREKHITINTSLEPMFSLEFDTTLIKEVVINLVENAIKYTPHGGSIEVISQEEDDLVHVIVKDTGEGIKPEDMEKVWGKFTRGSDQDMKTKGTGLGLYLVKYFIELHGGKVKMESVVGTGTTVSFTLPLDTESESEVLA
ncbi:CHASE2 and HATPase_c domain-containing protein [Bdellovibrio reynosensis]|uniref:histidine kinase n=1 Tax=Bdellovibrio reynosensis TaxID=2835041 RepID=A0ABY4CET6_9BACT|nr:CHASE2 and HATPase_c domain-containing protein [Bdellovibrio reynosensis]UOF02402.1 CHASE2 and HATPase_c domain-containing protein [Bdellovibrio reynosensis]